MTLLPIVALCAGLLEPAPRQTSLATRTPARTPGSPLPRTPDPSRFEAASLIAEADLHFGNRSLGAIEEVADPREVDTALALYRTAFARSPRDIEALAKLLRAMHFRGAFTGAGLEEKKAIFDLGRTLGQTAVDRLEADAKATRGRSRIESLRLTRGAPALYLWTAVHWGEWGLAKGKFTAARSGVGSRLRDLAQTVVDLDPLFEDAAGYRILGRLHAVAPKILFITGWVSRDKALLYLRRAHGVSPHHPVNSYFLAEALLDHEPGNTDEAVRLLEQCAGSPPRPDSLLEDSRYSRLARARVGVLRGASEKTPVR